MDVNIFKAIGDLALSAKRRTEREHRDFLAFYRQLIEALPAEMIEVFGHMPRIPVKLKNGAEGSYGIELTVTDFMWWKQKIEAEGVRFLHGPASVKCDMLNRFSINAEAQRLDPDERKKLLSLLDQANSEK